MTEQEHVPLDEITLRRGGHNTREDGVCFMEAAAWFAGEPHSDHPECVCEVLGSMGRALNDTLPEEKRIRMLPFVPRVIGTAGDGMSERRGLMAADWLIRVYTPTWLRLAGLDDEAAALEALPEVVDTATMEGALGALNRARKSAVAARDAAGAAAWDAAGVAARDAAWAAAGAAAGAAAWDAAWDAAGAAAWAAAWAAARAAAGAAAWDAAWGCLAPTVRELQDSAIDLYARMCSLRSERDTDLTPSPTEAKVGA